jgi:hypothetical protein
LVSAKKKLIKIKLTADIFIGLKVLVPLRIPELYRGGSPKSLVTATIPDTDRTALLEARRLIETSSEMNKCLVFTALLKVADFWDTVPTVLRCLEKRNIQTFKCCLLEHRQQ